MVVPAHMDLEASTEYFVGGALTLTVLLALLVEPFEPRAVTVILAVPVPAEGKLLDQVTRPELLIVPAEEGLIAHV